MQLAPGQTGLALAPVHKAELQIRILCKSICTSSQTASDFFEATSGTRRKKPSSSSPSSSRSSSSSSEHRKLTTDSETLRPHGSTLPWRSPLALDVLSPPPGPSPAKTLRRLQAPKTPAALGFLGHPGCWRWNEYVARVTGSQVSRSWRQHSPQTSLRASSQRGASILHQLLPNLGVHQLALNFRSIGRTLTPHDCRSKLQSVQTNAKATHHGELDFSRTSVGPQSDLGRTSVGPRSDLSRTSVGPQSDLSRTSVGPQSGPSRTPVGHYTSTPGASHGSFQLFHSIRIVLQLLGFLAVILMSPGCRDDTLVGSVKAFMHAATPFTLDFSKFASQSHVAEWPQGPRDIWKESLIPKLHALLRCLVATSLCRTKVGLNQKHVVDDYGPLIWWIAMCQSCV